MILSNKTYDILKDLVEIYLPGLATLYFTLSGIWGFPYGEQIVGTIAAVCIFLGLFLKKSSIEYNKPAPVDVSGLVYLEDGDENEQY